MNPEQYKFDRTWIVYPIVGIILILSLFIGGTVLSVQAQSVDTWTNPENLSNSGSANNPVFVIDSDGIFHVIWMDEFAGMV
jgi:hypothetical protein